MTTFLYGAYGTGNLGDDLLLKSALEIHGKDSVAVAYGAPFLRDAPIWIDHDAFIQDPSAFLAAGDRLIFAGGGLFWAASHADVMLNCAKVARSVGCDVSIERIGAQGYHSNPGAVKELITYCSTITVRDEHSVKLLVEAGITDRATYAPDFALVLQDVPDRVDWPCCRIGINHSATPFFHEDAHRRKTLEIYSRLAAANSDVEFVYIPHTRHFRVMAQNDVVYGEYFWNASGGRIEALPFSSTVEDFLDLYSTMSGTIGWRYHLLATSVRMEIPTAFLGQHGGHKYGAISREHDIPQINFDLGIPEVLGSANRFVRSICTK